MVGSIRSDRYTDHRLTVNLHDHPAADSSVVDDEWCVVVRLACVNADHCRQEHSTPTKIDVGQNVRALTFTWNGEYLATGDVEEVWVWRVKDGKQVARMETRSEVYSLAASKNGKWIAAGTFSDVIVWNAETYEEVIKHSEDKFIRGVDFSPDSTRLVAAANRTTLVWDLATGKQVQTHPHIGWVIAAKYSPRGDRIATATYDGPVRVWDSNDGHLLVDIDVQLTLLVNTSLLWFNEHLLVLSDKKIEEFDASTGSKVSEWPVPYTDCYSCVALPKHEEFIASSSINIITFWDTSTHNPLYLVQYPGRILSIAFSPDDQILAIGGTGNKIIVQSSSHIAVSAESHRLWRV